MASNRKESESIDKRNAAVMQLESEHRKLRAALQKVVDGWNAIDPDEQVPESLNDGRMDEAEALLDQVKQR